MATANPKTTALKSTLIRNVAVSKLTISPHNVRRTAASAEDDNELKASILANGVGQNLIVHARRAKGKETFLGAAGGRRLRALEALLVEDRIPDTFEVPVRVVSEKEAEEISLVENVVRSGMHPADEFEAFARMIENGSTIEQVATRFGTSPLAVERRMKLGKLHPDLLALYREGAMTLEACKALTLTSDHDRQWQAWEATETERRYNRDGLQHTIRRVLTAEGVKSTTRVGRLVDPKLYEEAGGRIARDLFAGRAGSDVGLTYEDPALAEKLALAALEAHAEPLRSEWKWVVVSLEPEPHRQGWSRLSPVPIDVPEELTAELDRVYARVEELESFDEEDAWTEEMSEELDALYEKRGQLDMQLEGHLGFTPEQKAASGVIVGPGHDGITEAKGILSPDDIAAVEEANRVARAAAEAAETAKVEISDPDATSDDENDDADGSQKDEPAEPIVAAPVPTVLPGQPAGIARTAEAIERGEVEQKDAPIHSQSLDLDLRQTRRQILAAHVADDFGAAFDMLLWQMAKGIFSVSYVSGRPLECNFRPDRDAPGSVKLDDTAAKALLAAHEEGLSLDFMQLAPAESFAALCELPDEDKQALFAWCVSTMLVSQSTPVIQAVGVRLGVQVAQFWRPTAENYWGRVKKDVSLDAARETVGMAWASDHKDQKKGVLAQSMEKVFAENRGIGLSDEELARAKAWLPVGMAFDVNVPLADVLAPQTEGDSVDPTGTGEDEAPTEADQGTGAEVISVPAFLRGAAA